MSILYTNNLVYLKFGSYDSFFFSLVFYFPLKTQVYCMIVRPFKLRETSGGLQSLLLLKTRSLSSLPRGSSKMLWTTCVTVGLPWLSKKYCVQSKPLISLFAHFLSPSHRESRWRAWTRTLPYLCVGTEGLLLPG